MIVTLTLWVPEDLSPRTSQPGAQELAEQLDAFSDAYPDMQVEVVVKKAQGRGGLLDFLRSAQDAAPSVMPDLIILDVADLETAASAGLIHPLDDLISPTTVDDQFPFAMAMGQVQTRTMGYLMGATMQHAAYRVDQFETANITWTGVISSSQPFLLPAAGHDDLVNDATLIQYLAAGGDIIDSEGNPTLSHSTLEDVFDFYSDCISRTIISPSAMLDIGSASDTWNLLTAGEGGIAIVPAGQYWLDNEELFSPAFIPTPEGQPLGFARGWALALVTSDPTRQSTAMLLFDWLTAPDHSAQWTQAAGYLPGTRGALQLWNLSNAERSFLFDLLDAATTPPRKEVMEVIGPALQNGLEALFEGWATPEEAATIAVESLTE
jgi:ABC-type glycerol-3-phosphate transport system substrate-binding protein